MESGSGIDRGGAGDRGTLVEADVSQTSRLISVGLPSLSPGSD